MNRKIFITHVESMSQFIKIHGQTDRNTATQIEFAIGTAVNLFSTYPPPLINMLDVDSMILVNYDGKTFRGKFCGAASDKTVNVRLIDLGCVITTELRFVRVLSVCPNAADFLRSEPPQASEFILSQCKLSNDLHLPLIKDNIIFLDIPYKIAYEVGKKTLISLHPDGRNYAERLIGAKLVDQISLEQQKKFLMQMQISTPVPRPINKAIRNQYSTSDSGLSQPGPIKPTSKQMIASHLGIKIKQVPQNMPSYQPKIPPIDYNANRVASTNPTQTSTTNSDPTAKVNIYHIPTFISDTLLVDGRHEVYVSHIEDGPNMFSVHLKTSEKKLNQMMEAISKCELRNLTRKPSLGMACIARFSEDGNLYRGVIMSIHIDSCQILYVDYGNSEKVFYNHIYDIPEEFLVNKTLEIRVSLAGLKTLPPLSENIKTYFENMVTDKLLDMQVTPIDGPPFVQYCELTLNGEKILNRLKDLVENRPKFIEPTQLSENDFVVIRYVESPKLFCVQQTKNIVAYNSMMDKLFQHCLTSPPLTTFEIGTLCASRFKDDAEWYRAEIISVQGKEALIRFVDYGIAITTETDKLKIIDYEFLTMPKQAVLCCLKGFDTMQTVSNSSQEQMDHLFAEDSFGQRRNFRVKIIGKNVNGAELVNLIDESQVPPLDLSYRMLQLNMPHKSFRQYEMQIQNENSSERQTNIKSTDSSYVDSGVGALASPPDPKGRSNGQHYNDTQSSGIGSDLGSPMKFEKMNVKDAKFYKNKHYANPLYESSIDQANNRTATSMPSRPEEKIHKNTQISYEQITLNSILEVRVCWWISPLEFYVSTIRSDADLDYTLQMKNIHHFYKTKSPAANKVDIGSFAIVKYIKNNQLHRAKIVDYNEKFNKYKAQLIDLGALAIVDPGDVYEMDKRFAKLERQAIPCSLRDVALCTSRQTIDNFVDKFIGNRTVLANFFGRKRDVFYVDIEVNGVNLRESLIREGFLSVLLEDIRIERLVGQTVLADILSVKDLSSFQLLIYGCDTKFEASYKDLKKNEDIEYSKLPLRQRIPVRIDALLIGNTFAVTPLIESFGEAPLPYICNFPFFSDNFEIYVAHWQSSNMAYVQSVYAENLSRSILEPLYDYYEVRGPILKEFVPGTLCAAKSTDENWYRGEILSETDAEVNIRYIDYGNCELIPKAQVKRLESQFFDKSALAVKVYLPIVHSADEDTLNKISTLTKDVLLDLKVVEFYHNNWIVDISNKNTSIMFTMEKDNLCKTMAMDELKKQIDADKEAMNETIKFRLQKQQQQNNPIKQIKSTAQISQVLSKPVQPITHEVPSAVTQNAQLHNPQTKSTITAYISHIDRPDRFYLQVASNIAELDQLQENIQIVAPSLPNLEDFNAETRCIVRYSVDDKWYRAIIIDSDTKITSILFMDYGNTDTITDNSSIKSMNDAFDQIPAFAIPCALPLEAKYRNEWSDESCDFLKDLYNDTVEFEYVCKGKSNNFVKLYQGDRDIMEELIGNGDAIKLDSIRSGEKCYVSHVNSISDFYIQMDSDAPTLEIMADYLADYSRFEEMSDIKEGVVCAAKFLDDGMWYRAKIKSHSAGNTEVFFCDYGNSSSTNELRIIPSEIANGPTLAKYCALRKPKDVQFWSDKAEQYFYDYTDGSIVFTVDVITPGKKSIVDLIVNEKSILDDIADLCDKYSLSALENTLQSNAVIESETVKAFIVTGTPEKFYDQLESSTNEINRLNDLMESAVEWPKLNEKIVGHLCAALFEGSYYRAKILSLNDEGANVHFIDYGNELTVTDVRKLPENLESIQQLSMLCSLESNNSTFTPELIERFENLSKSDPIEMKFISKTTSLAIVQLFENGVLFTEKQMTTNVNEENVAEKIVGTADTKQIGQFKAFISERVSPNHFYIQLNNDMEQAMESASTFPLLADNDKAAGKICAALWEDYFYRAEILSVDEQGTKVHFIDYGNDSYSHDLRQLPDDIERIERSAIQCSLDSENQVFSTEFALKFNDLDLNNQFEFEFVKRSDPLNVVRLYVDGELFMDTKQPVNNAKTDCKPKDGQTETEIDTKSIANEIIDRPPIDVTQQKSNSLKTEEIGKFKAFISERVSPSHFYIQMNNDMEQAMESASTFPLLDDCNKCAGEICAALWEEYFYRAEILSVDEQGTKVHFIDFGNESYSDDLRELPDDIKRIERASLLCTLENENQMFSDEFVDKFNSLDLADEFEFEFISRTNGLNVVRLHVDGELFLDCKGTADNAKTDEALKSGQFKTESENELIVKDVTMGRAGQREFDNEVIAQIIDHNVNGTENPNQSECSLILDSATEAARITMQHFESVEQMGLATTVPPNL